MSQLSELVPALTTALPQLLDEVQSQLEPVSPSYGWFLAENREELIASAEAAMAHLVLHAERRLDSQDASLGAGPDVVRALFEQVGRSHRQQGLELVTLLSAYQVGGRTAWRWMSDLALAHCLAPAALAVLAESMFFLIDQLSSASTSGYLAEHAEEAADREHLRDVLVELLLSDRSNAAAVQEAAIQAGWRLPRIAAVIWIAQQDDGWRRLAKLDPSVLLVRGAVRPGAIVPDPNAPGRRQRLIEALRGSEAVIGRAMPLDMLPASAYIAEIAAGIQRTGLLGTDPLFVDDHLDAVIVNRDQRLIGVLRDRCLEPLSRASPASREVLTQTLRAWLLHMGDRRLIARDLQVHPQTVRYRMARLHELFGPDLTDPTFRRRLMLVLAWEPD